MEDTTHTHGNAWFGVLGFTFAIFYKIWENPYTQDFLHGLISGAGGAIAAIVLRWLYNKFVKKDPAKPVKTRYKKRTK